MDDLNHPSLKSFVDVEADSPFPIQNLPFGVFRPHQQAGPRIGVAIGKYILDLAALANANFLKVSVLPADFFARQQDLHAFMACDHSCWQAVRRRLSEL